MLSHAGLLDFFRRKKKEPEPEEFEPEPPLPVEDERKELPEWLKFDADMTFEGGGIKIMVTLSNEGTELIGKPIISVTVSPRLFKVPQESFEEMDLEPGQTMKAEFHLTPVGEVSKYSPKVEVEYFDFTLRERVGYTLDLEPIIFDDEFNVVPYGMGQDEFRVFSGQRSPLEVETDELYTDPKKLFESISENLDQAKFNVIEPQMIAPEVYRAVGQFTCKDQDGDPYGVGIQVIGKNGVSRLLLRIWTDGSRGLILRKLLVRLIDNIYPISNHIVSE